MFYVKLTCGLISYDSKQFFVHFHLIWSVVLLVFLIVVDAHANRQLNARTAHNNHHIFREINTVKPECLNMIVNLLKYPL